jgi:hypothetical protein
MNSIRLPGQGRALPRDFPYKGEWLAERRIFLYVPDAQHSLGAGIQEMTPVHQFNESEWCFGINAMVLAFQLHVGSHEIFAYNRRGTLLLVRVDEPLPTAGATHARRYTFQVDDRQTSITIEGGTPSGAA